MSGGKTEGALQSVLKPTGDLLALIYKPAFFQPVLGETLEPGFLGWFGMYLNLSACIRI